MNSKKDNIISRIKTEMAYKNLNISQLAKKAGIQRVGLSNILLGKTDPKIETLGKIAIALDLNPIRFFGGSSDWSEDDRLELEKLRIEYRVEQEKNFNRQEEYFRTKEGQIRIKWTALTGNLSDQKITIMLPIVSLLSKLSESNLMDAWSTLESRYMKDDKSEVNQAKEKQPANAMKLLDRIVLALSTFDESELSAIAGTFERQAAKKSINPRRVKAAR